MKIFSLAPKENWILDRITKEWSELDPELFTDDPTQADVLWVISPWLWRRIPASLLSEKKVVVTIHHIVPEKFKTKEFISQHTNKPIKVIGYWYNGNTWTPYNKSDARKDLELPEDSFIIGSFQRDTEGSDLISPKLEKGPDLFADVVKKISNHIENVYVLLGGWRRQYVISRLEKDNIKYKFIKMAPLEELRKMYAACDLYIVSSRCEGGPQAILEASAMKVPIISRDVGMASAVLPASCIMDIPNYYRIPDVEDIDNCYNGVPPHEINECSKQYKQMFLDLMEQK
jgi:glycosyltransferase involved in cell wall biosynthesis